MLLYKDGHVNREINEVCRERFVRVAFNQYPEQFEVNTETNSMIAQPDEGLDRSLTREILSSFFANNKLTPIFYDCKNTWGSLNKETGEWNGAVGMVGFLDVILF